MDSLTQLTLGAAVGEAVLGRQLGNRAIFWGAVAGTLPDLDVLAAPWLSDLGFLIHHRGITHSILVLAAASPLLAGLAARACRGRPDAPITHVLLDACTTYGTPHGLPLSDRRFALNNIFIVDPLYTAPMLAAIVACLFLPRTGRARRWVNFLGIAASCLYLAATFAGQFEARRAFERSLAEQEIAVRRMMVAPTPLNSILWYAIAESEDGYYLGYHSQFDDAGSIPFHFIPRGDHLLAGIEETYPIERLKWFADGYYAVRREGDDRVFHVLKFGLFTLDGDVDQVGFSYRIERREDGSVEVRKLPQARPTNLRESLAKLWRRMWGDRT
jgi:inner membrane protein